MLLVFIFIQRNRSRKRERNETSWKENVRKRRRSRGESYFSRNGKEVQAKFAASNINLCTCGRQSDLKFSSGDREKIFSEFYAMTKECKDQLIYDSIHKCAPKRTTEKSRKKATFLYFVSETQVCLEAFCKLLLVSEKIVRRVRKGKEVLNLAPFPSQQGKHNNRPKAYSKEAIEEVVAHIESFPADASHYSRSKNINRKYLPCNLNKSKMYSLYKVLEVTCFERRIIFL